VSALLGHLEDAEERLTDGLVCGVEVGRGLSLTLL